MTPELAQHILEQEYNKDCYKKVVELYECFSPADIVAAISRWRAQQSLTELPVICNKS